MLLYPRRKCLSLMALGSAVILLFLCIHHWPGKNVEHEIEFNQREEKLKRNVSCIYPEITNVKQFFDYRKKKKHCKKLIGFGGPAFKIEDKYYDGEKKVCMDSEYNIKPENCIVLSFGIAEDWSFDDAMGKFGCQVFSFDPTIGKEDHNRSNNVRFFNLGLSDEKKIQNFKLKVSGKVDRYEAILKMLHLTNREIDYLKIDIEEGEINFFKDIFTTSPHLLKNVKQIGMEIHTHNKVGIFEIRVRKSSDIYSLWHGMQKLECAGFKLLSHQINVAGNNPYKWRNRVVSQCYEIVWGRISNSE